MTLMLPIARVGTPRDAPDLARVQRAAAVAAFANIFPPSLPKPKATELEWEWKRLCGEEGSTVLVGELEKVVGAAAIGIDDSTPAGILLARLYVDPASWGKRVGGVLHATALSIALRRGFPALNLWVLAGNRQARDVYEHWGWRLVQGRSRWIADGSVEEVMYQLDLK